MTDTIKKLPIIALDHTPWHGNWMNRQHILSRLGKRGWPVTYSNGAAYYDKVDFRRPFTAVEQTDHISLYRPGYALPRNYRFPKLDRLAIARHCHGLKQAAGIRDGDAFIILCFHPDFYPYVEEMNPTFTMFHIYDVYHRMSSTNGGDSNVAKLVERSDLVTAASDMIWDEVVNDKNRSALMIYNGVDSAAFAIKNPYKGQTYNSIKKLPPQRVGYLGAINCKIDFIILDHLAKNFPKTQFIMIGAKRQIDYIHKDAQNWTAYQHFFNRPNVYYFDSIERSEIPACLDLMDVTIAPYKMDRSTWAFAGFPLKINEYLAAGKPVISSTTTTVTQHFNDIIAICENSSEWQNALSLALKGEGVSTEENRRQKARENDWDNRLDQLEQFMFAMLAEKKVTD